MMKTSIVGIASLALGLVAIAAPARAQIRWGHEAVPRAGACFYEDANFRGRYFCANAGEDLGSLPSGMGDQISSIRVFGGAEVSVFRDRGFRGASAHFGGDIDNLKRRGWNDQISSIRIDRGRGLFGGDRDRDRDRDSDRDRDRERSGGPVWGRGPMPREGACFFEDSNFRGRYFCVGRGERIASMPSGFNDRISSIRVFRDSVTIYRDSDFRGRSRRLRGDVSNLGSEWGDRISSIRVN